MVDYFLGQSSITAILHGVCSCCGLGKFFVSLLTIRDYCPVCNAHDGRLNADNGSIFFIIIYSAIILHLAAWFQFFVDPRAWVHIVVWPPIIVAGATTLMLPLTAWLIAQQFRDDVDDDAGKTR